MILLSLRALNNEDGGHVLGTCMYKLELLLRHHLTPPGLLVLTRQKG